MIARIWGMSVNMDTYSNILFTGDCHAQFERFKDMAKPYKPAETAIVILGDVGINLLSSWENQYSKQQLISYGYTYYLLRGNHDKRPEKLKKIKKIFDTNVNNYVYVERGYPTIKYLIDGLIYGFNGKKALALGGAYSPDAKWRLAQNLPYEPDEQMSNTEFLNAYELYKNQEEKLDLILSHSCPYEWLPQDLLLSGISQKDMDYHTENWLQKFADLNHYSIWLYGHFHDNRIAVHGNTLRIMLYKNIINLKEVS